MKVYSEKEFRPITIVLESKDEVRAIYNNLTNSLPLLKCNSEDSLTLTKIRTELCHELRQFIK